MNLLDDLYELLRQDDRLWGDGELLKNQVVELALNLDNKLLSLLVNHDRLGKHFFASVDSIHVFDREKFIRFVESKEFLPDSYTTFKNAIGLIEGERYLNESRDVVVAWPYKDCVLQGGQSEEDKTRDEVFWNQILAPDEIDRLLQPKVMTRFKRFDASGEHDIEHYMEGDNLLIEGNNLLAISSLGKRYAGKIKLVCIDPPYNRGKDDFGYNDSFRHSTWLTFMKTRLELSRGLLHPDGSIFVFCDETEHAYLKVLMDEIFGRKSFITTVVWRNSDNSNNDAKKFSLDHNYILVYSRNTDWESIKLPRTEEQSRHYANPDNDPRGPWFDGNPISSPNPRPNLMYKLEAPDGNQIDPPANGWRWDKEAMKTKIESGEIRFTEDGTSIRRRTYLKEQKDLPPSTLWKVTEDNLWVDLNETGHTRQAKYEQKRLFPKYPTSELFRTPKPEKVIQKIIHISTREGDYVLDFFAGSGTTPAVALKMGRRFIGCEQMDYVHTFTIPRLRMVIEGEDGGVSKSLGWKGGGSFVYCRLMEWNMRFVDRIHSASDKETLQELWVQMREEAFLSYRLEVKAFDKHADKFSQLEVESQKEFLLEALDKNQLYVNVSEMEDEIYAVSPQDKSANSSFYGLG